MMNIPAPPPVTFVPDRDVPAISVLVVSPELHAWSIEVMSRLDGEEYFRRAAAMGTELMGFLGCLADVDAYPRIYGPKWSYYMRLIDSLGARS
jgi:hypothetical protein